MKKGLLLAVFLLAGAGCLNTQTNLGSADQKWISPDRDILFTAPDDYMLSYRSTPVEVIIIQKPEGYVNTIEITYRQESVSLEEQLRRFQKEGEEIPLKGGGTDRVTTEALHTKVIDGVEFHAFKYTYESSHPDGVVYVGLLDERTNTFVFIAGNYDLDPDLQKVIDSIKFEPNFFERRGAEVLVDEASEDRE